MLKTYLIGVACAILFYVYFSIGSGFCEVEKIRLYATITHVDPHNQSVALEYLDPDDPDVTREGICRLFREAKIRINKAEASLSELREGDQVEIEGKILHPVEDDPCRRGGDKIKASLIKVTRGELLVMVVGDLSGVASFPRTCSCWPEKWTIC